MTTIHVQEMNVHYFMCITGYNFLFSINNNTTSKKNYFINELEERGEYLLN